MLVFVCLFCFKILNCAGDKCLHWCVPDCGPSGVPNGQWMKIPRPGKLRVLYFNTGLVHGFQNDLPKLFRWCNHTSMLKCIFLLVVHIYRIF